MATTPDRLRIRHLSITGFKAIDHLELDFPEPLAAWDPDVLVLGSRNGAGKTSVLEACALLFFVLEQHPWINWKRATVLDSPSERSIPDKLAGLVVRAGSQESRIGIECQSGDLTSKVELRFDRQGSTNVAGDLSELSRTLQKGLSDRQIDAMQILGDDAGPVVLPRLAYFHSYRRIRDGEVDLGQLVSGSSVANRFKVAVLRAVMAQADLYEGLDSNEGESQVRVLNELLLKYAQGSIAKFRALPDSTTGLRIAPLTGGPPYSFDGLSSGQKEIISTLFLIWEQTRTKPSIVLIDEPELHLNPEWHRTIIRDLHELVPLNQYIVATHSEDVFGSVDSRQRVLLSLDPVAAKP